MGTLVPYMCLNYAAYRWVVFRSYRSLEQTEADKDIARCMGALRSEIHHLSLLTNDWAAWDDTYRFVQDRNENYIKSNLVVESFTDNHLDLIYIYNLQRQIVWGEVRDPVTHKRIRLEELSAEGIKKVQGLFQPDKPSESVSGVWMTSMSPILIACRPILKSNDQGPVAGWLMMGQILTKAFARKLSERTQVTQTYDPIRGGVPAAHPRELMGRITAEHPIAFDAVSDTLLKAYAVFPDISGHPALLVQADINRSIWSRAESALWFIMISTATVGALLLVGILVLLNRVVSRPVADLTQRVISFGENQVFHPCPLSGRRDEVGTLYREFERMATQLSSVHQGLWDSNRLLAHEIQERRLFSERLSLNQERLRALSSELVMSEDRERRRIATELHDGIGQDLAMLHLQVELLLQQGNGTPNTVTEKLEAIRGAIEKIIHDSRSLTFEISPPVLYELGLGPAIEWLAEEISERHGIQVDVLDYASVHLDDSMRALIFRSVRELLYNVVKHARASRVRVTLEQEDETLNIGVEDDGLGFSMEDGAGRAATGLGLFSIQERFIQLGGKIDIGSGEKTGARVTLYLPLGITSNANTEAC